MFKIFSNNFISVQSKDEIEEISINNYYLKNLEEKNEYDKKLTPASDKSSVVMMMIIKNLMIQLNVKLLKI